MYQVTIPVKPFVAKYIYARYGLQPANGHIVWRIDKSDKIGKIVFNLLERVPRIQSQPPEERGAWLSIGINYHTFQNKGIFLSNRSIYEFNEQIQLEIIEEIAMYINHLQHNIGIKKYDELRVVHTTTHGKSRRRAITRPSLMQYFETKEIIYDILQRYNITEDDYPFETIAKQLRRLKLPLLKAS